ncbi:MAG: 2-oxo acid dehydrogenase subunit E2 [Asgard group archaeon]|nr:2-oxo acid dehydrogenase subunit E2 [Asgard group archaeon]
MVDKDSYKVEKFPLVRKTISEFGHQSKYFNHIKGIYEVDVTKAWHYIKDYKEKTGTKISFTSWIMNCVAQAISEYKTVQAFRWGRNKMVTFDDVDVKCNVEKEINGNMVPIPYIVRKANEKSLREIHEEIRNAQQHDKDQRKKERSIKKRQNFIMSLPKFIRNIIWKIVMRSPFKMKKHFGTIGLTAMGMFGRNITGWAIPKTGHSTTFAIGAVKTKPIVVNDEIKKREMLHMTVEFNHDTVDGGPAVRFVQRLIDLLESGFALDTFASE